MKNICFKKTLRYLSVAVLASSFSSTVLSQSCDSYPYQPSENVIEFDGNGKFKILSTGAASVDFDDPSEVMSGRREAELLAKRTIAEYINQKLTSEDNISSEISKSKTNTKAVDGSTISTVQRDEVKKQLSSISTRADAVLKGVISIGSCYSKGREIRVTVGFKSETLANATTLEKSMGAAKAASYGVDPAKANNNSNLTNENSTNSKSENPAQVGTQNYDGSSQLKKF